MSMGSRVFTQTHYQNMPAIRSSKSSKSTGALAPHTAMERRTRSATIANLINVVIQPDIPTHVLTVQVRGPVNLKADMDKDPDEVRSHSFFCILQ